MNERLIKRGYRPNWKCFYFLADRTNGRATTLRASPSVTLCIVAN